MTLSPTMRAVLTNLAAGKPASHGMPGGRSFAGGFGAVMLGLRRRGLISGLDQLTDKGREVAALLKDEAS